MQSQIRNFAIIAHIDHGKSTLSDRFLEITETVSKNKLQEQFLDQNPISRERGITIKLAPVRMQWKGYILNLIDTPGHVDFSYDVSRTLAACEGAILLVDATQGVQAQTVAHFYQAQKEGLKILPVINKIDMPSADTDKVTQEIEELFGFLPNDVTLVSAKTGQNVKQLLEKIITDIPPPSGNSSLPLRSLIFDAVYDEHRGVIAQVRVVDGSVKKGDLVTFLQTKAKADVTEVGVFTPFLRPTENLETGSIGYIVSGIKDIRQVRVGDTITIQNSKVRIQNSKGPTEGNENRAIVALPGYKTPQPMVFFGVYPQEKNDYAALKESLAKLALSDASLTIADEYSAFLGSGFRVGFLGLLHAEIVQERLKEEFGIDPLLTMPHVLYKNDENGGLIEPYMELTIYAPSEYVGNIMTLCQKRKGNLINMTYHGSNTVLVYEMPYSMFVRGLAADIKAASSGFASFDYTLTDYKSADLQTLEIKINGEPIDVLTEKVYKDEADYIARRRSEKLKETLERQQFRQIIQGVIDGRILAREEIPPYRKDVLSKMSGGDRTRKDKLLEAQKKGKSRLKTHGRISISQEALLSMIKNN